MEELSRKVWLLWNSSRNQWNSSYVQIFEFGNYRTEAVIRPPPPAAATQPTRREQAPWLRRMWGMEGRRRGRRGSGRLLALLTASALAMMERSTWASGDRVSALKLAMARSLTWPNMHVWVPQLRLDSDFAAMGKQADEEAEAGSKVNGRYATPLICADEGSEGRYEGSQPRTSGPMLPSTAADFKTKYVSPLADTILIIKEQERQHMLQARTSQKSEPKNIYDRKSR